MKLYGLIWSQHSRRIVSLLEQENIDYEFISVDLSKGEHLQPDFLAMNPNHQVPVLRDQELVLFESNAILRYLCNKHDLANWYPTAAQSRAVVDQWLDWIQCVMSPQVVNIVLNTVFMGENGDKSAIDSGLSHLPNIWKIIDEQLSKNEFLTGTQPTIADLALVSNVYHLSFAKQKSESDSLNNWYEKMMSLPGVINSLPKENPFT